MFYNCFGPLRLGTEEIQLSLNEADLKLKVGSGDWRPLRVRSFDITETMPDAEDLPSWIKVQEEDIETIKASSKQCQDPEEVTDEIAQAYAEGGKHAYAPSSATEKGLLQPTGVEAEQSDEELDDAPDWIACLSGVKFFTLKQALDTTSADMHLRRLSKLSFTIFSDCSIITLALVSTCFHGAY